MREDTTRAPWWRSLAAGGVAWTAIALLFAGNSYASRLMAGRPAPFLRLVAYVWLSWIFFALATPALVALVRRFPLERGRWRGSLAAIAASGLVFVVAMAAWDAGTVRLLAAFMDTTALLGTLATLGGVRLFEELLLRNAATTLLAYAGTLAALQAMAYYRGIKQRELRTSQLEAQLAHTRLAVLETQLKPHFLFNTLNSIASLVHSDADAAERMIVLLSDLLRATLSTPPEHEVELRQELEFLGRYLEIERMRFPDRLGVAIEASDETLDALVPNLLLQPLVENAIRHGISPRLAPGRVTVRAARRDGLLHLEVADDGVGLPNGHAAAGAEGVGLSNTRERLRQLYGDDGTFTLADNPGGGLVVGVAVPFRVRGGRAGSGGPGGRS